MGEADRALQPLRPATCRHTGKPGQGAAKHILGSGRVAGHEPGLGQGDFPFGAAVVVRRQVGRAPQQRGSGRVAATGARPFGRLLEFGREFLVGDDRRRGQVTYAQPRAARFAPRTVCVPANNALALNVTVPDGVEATARDGNLTLTGAVEYGRQRKAAELAVAGLVGVRNVKDDIDISYDAGPVDVTLFVQDALDRNALVDDDSDVSVDASGNTVTLRGYVRTWAERDAVVSAAWMAGGVMQVRDDLDITS